MANQLTLMIVHAHPDDEVIGSGGTFARYAREGVRTVLVTATLGEEGDIVVPEMDTAENHAGLADIRRGELQRATEILGIAHQEFLGYRDSGMAGRESNNHPACFHQANRDEATGRLVRLIRAYRPQVLVSYNAHGGYGHPDHIACYHVTHAAFAAAADPTRYPKAGPAWAVAKLYEMNRPRERTRTAWEQMRERGLKTPLDNPDYQIENYTAPDEVVTTAIDLSDYIGLKRAALLEHRTQIAADGPFLGMPEDIGRTWYGTEFFTLVTARVPLPPHEGYETDLFAGLR